MEIRGPAAYSSLYTSTKGTVQLTYMLDRLPIHHRTNTKSYTNTLLHSHQHQLRNASKPSSLTIACIKVLTKPSTVLP